MDEKSDAGDIIYQEKVNLDKHDNFYSIHLKIIKKGTKFFEKFFIDFNNGKIKSTKQNLGKGKVYGKKYFYLNPQVYELAWKNLIKEKKRLNC